MAWLRGMVLGSRADAVPPSPVKGCKVEDQDVSPFAAAGRSQSRDSLNTGSTDASDQDILSPPSASSRQLRTERQDAIPELVAQCLDLESKSVAEVQAGGVSHELQQHASTEEGRKEVDGSAGVEYTHKFVPKSLDLALWSNLCNFGYEPMQPTTWMVRNVPNKYTQDDLKAELEDLGFAGAFDFLYMPVDKSSKASVGYAFVNITPELATSFPERMKGHKFTRHGKSKEALVSVAHMQGLPANLAHYQQCAMKSAKVARHRPFVQWMPEFYYSLPS